jgi:hypothetical protein
MAIDVERLPGWRETAWTHDYALEGDEDLSIGKLVELTDGVNTTQAVVTYHSEEQGYWTFQGLGPLT